MSLKPNVPVLRLFLSAELVLASTAPPISAITLLPLTCAPAIVVSSPLLMLMRLPASMVVSLCCVPLPDSLPLEALPLAEMLIPAPLSPMPMPIPIAPPLLLFSPSSHCVFCEEIRLMSSAAFSATSSPALIWLPMVVISPPVAVIDRLSPAVSVLPVAVFCPLWLSDLDDCVPTEALIPKAVEASPICA
jgi:hypothetical protein